MGAVRIGRLVAAALDPVLVPAGFSPGQYGEGSEDVDRDAQIIFCASHDPFSERYPYLPQAHQQEPGGTCVDLVVDVRAGGTITSIHVEGFSAEETLRRVGLAADGVAVAGVEGCPADVGLPVIAAALRRLFSAGPDVRR